MGTYSKLLLVELERRLVAADADKKHKKRFHKGCRGLPSPRQLAEELNMPEAYIRRVAWEKKLDPFQGDVRDNDMWLAAYCVVALGWAVRDASTALGFTHASIEAFLHAHGWVRYVVWGNKDKRLLHVPAPITKAGWKVRKEPVGWTGDYGHYEIPANYFSKKRR